MGAGIGDMISGVTGIFTGMDEGQSEEKASRLQLNRETRAASAGIVGAQEKGEFESGKQRMMTSQLVAKQKQAYAKSGVDATQGTAAAVQADTAALGELDAQQLSINAAREAWGYKEAKKQAREEYDTRSGNIDRKTTGAMIGSMSKFIGGAAKLAGG